MKRRAFLAAGAALTSLGLAKNALGADAAPAPKFRNSIPKAEDAEDRITLPLEQENQHLPPMPTNPGVADYFRFRAVNSFHLLMCGTLAMKQGFSEEQIVAALFHDFGQNIKRADHGYWGAQLIEPYVSPKVAFAVRYHQALRFYADASVGYKVPTFYSEPDFFGPNYKIPPNIEADYAFAKKNKWYMEARKVTWLDQYTYWDAPPTGEPNAPPALDADAVVKAGIEPFVDILGRHFKAPKEGLGYDNSPVAHMWRFLHSPQRLL